MNYDDAMNNANRNWELEYKAIRAELAIVKRDRDTLLQMTGATIEQVAARLRSTPETPGEPK